VLAMYQVKWPTQPRAGPLALCKRALEPEQSLFASECDCSEWPPAVRCLESAAVHSAFGQAQSEAVFGGRRQRMQVPSAHLSIAYKTPCAQIGEEEHWGLRFEVCACNKHPRSSCSAMKR